MDKEKKRILEEEENERKKKENEENQRKLNKLIVLWIIAALLFVGVWVSIFMQNLYLLIPSAAGFIIFLVIACLKLDGVSLYIIDKMQRREVKKFQESEEGKKWKKLKEVWLEDNLPEEIDYLYTYEYLSSHKDFFENFIADKNEEERTQVFTELKKLLPEGLYENLKSAYERYRECVRFGEEMDEETFYHYDDFYLTNSDAVNEKLLKFASTLDWEN